MFFERLFQKFRRYLIDCTFNKNVRAVEILDDPARRFAFAEALHIEIPALFLVRGIHRGVELVCRDGKTELYGGFF